MSCLWDNGLPSGWDSLLYESLSEVWDEDDSGIDRFQGRIVEDRPWSPQGSQGAEEQGSLLLPCGGAADR